MHAPGSGILIDDCGEVWSDSSPELARHLGYREPDFDAPGYAVRNLGFINVRQHEEGVRVSLRSGTFSLLTLAAALYELIDRRPRRIVLAVFWGQDWSYEMFTSIGSFAERAEDLASGEPAAGRPRWLAAERKLEALKLPAFEKTRPLVALWTASRGRLSDDLTRALRACDLIDRAVLVRQIGGTSRLVYEHFGSAIKAMRPCETFALIGRDVDDIADRAYGGWVAGSYASMLRKRRLRLDSIRATLRTSEDCTVKVRYDRLLMPWRRAGNDLFALGISMRRELSKVC
ncbi:MAG TPA: hypothetical protein VKB68_12780 [Stellaceae bacterium]|nr:hypothetical protein [Stellaceae bacterium]